MYDVFESDRHPEVYRHFFENYKGMLGDLGQLISNRIENPNRALRGKSEKTLVVSEFMGEFGENRFSAGFFEAKEEVNSTILRREYLKAKGEHKALAQWMNEGENRKIIQWYDRSEAMLKQLRKQRQTLEKQRKQGLSDEMYSAQYRRIAERFEQVYRKQLHEWRKMQGLSTTKPEN